VLLIGPTTPDSITTPSTFLDPVLAALVDLSHSTLVEPPHLLTDALCWDS
jgi:hypothetical protein